ncbi:MAG: LysR family transcriptional regulator [Neomegalonema sp.]|nr:LysR family transcriptional regulator [Neomegalonema sp.]
MDTNDLKLMLEIARRGSFAAVARALEIDPSAVSRRVSDVEAALGARLFHRTTRRLALTEAGAAYLAAAEEGLALLDHAQQELTRARHQPTGHLCITASVAFAQARLQPLLPEFLERYPQLSLHLRATDAVVDLVAESVDLAIRLGSEMRGDLICSKLRPTRYRVCASPTYLAAAPPIKTPTDLAEHPCVRFAFPAFRDRWRFRAAGAATAYDVSISGRLLLSTALGVRDAAIEGLGPALLTDWLVSDDIAKGRLIDLFPEHECAAESFDTAAWLVYPSRAYLPAKVRAAIDFFRARLGASAPAAA